ncbi:MAG: ion transporter [Deltaproteobacteria bacterium]|nr:ion transporter [Deltaproteobacteria bacterium]
MDRKQDWRSRLREVIFGTETPAGKAFDVLLIVSIFVSVGVVMLASVAEISAAHGRLLAGLEWFFTLLFTVEYLLRLVCVRRPWRYAVSFFGIVDLLAILPTYLALLLPGAKVFLIIRILRVLRIFRVLKLVQYMGEANLLIKALRASLRKITVFLFAVLCLVVVFGSLIYVIEGEAHGFTSIPKSIYWAIVTMTTVGYGDISPQTSFGQTLAALVMIVGYSIIAVPTGIVTAEIGRQVKERTDNNRLCQDCGSCGHDDDAAFCKYCGGEL